MKAKEDNISMHKKPVGSLVDVTYKGKSNEHYRKGQKYQLRVNQADEYDNLTKGWVLIIQKEKGDGWAYYKSTEDFLADWYINKIIAQWH